VAGAAKTVAGAAKTVAGPAKTVAGPACVAWMNCLLLTAKEPMK